MTSTPVKNVGSILMNLTASQVGKNTSGSGDFQKIWDGQMNRGAADSDIQSNAGGTAKSQMQKGDSLRTRGNRTVQNDDCKPAEELSPEEQEQVVEVLAAAAATLMEQIMDTFGVGAEELQSAMDELGVGQMDVLDESVLGALLMKLTGAEDPYALIMDGELYESYQMLMGQLDSILSESAESLGTEPELLLQLLETNLGGEVADVAEETESIELPVEKREDMRQVIESIDEASIPTASVTEGTVKKASESKEQTKEQSQWEGKPSDGKSEKEQQVNLFSASPRAEQFQPGLQQTQNLSQSGPWSAGTQEIMDQILDYMKLQLNADSTNLEMQLHPANLGTLQVQLASKGGMVTANFITQNEAVKAALETQMVQLKEQFEEQGVKVEAIEVTVQTHEFERNLDEQGRGRGSQEPERRNRARRISRNDPLSLENMDEAEALTADTMAADGSTVNYTA